MKRNVDCDTAFRTGLSARVLHSGNKSRHGLLFYPDLKFHYHHFLHTVLLSFFQVYSLNALQSDNKVIEFMFLGINIFWALLRAHFNPRLTARAKMSLSRAQNIFMPKNINSIVLL